MAVPSFGAKLVEHCELLGALEVRRLRLQNHFNSLDWQAIDAWLAVKEAEGNARAEERSVEANSIAKEANSIARNALNKAMMANIWAAIAALIAAIAIYAAIFIEKP